MLRKNPKLDRKERAANKKKDDMDVRKIDDIKKATKKHHMDVAKKLKDLAKMHEKMSK